MRSKKPTHTYRNEQGKETVVLIPFSSEFKFNLFVRDMGPNLCVFMKGAPEKILKRCAKVLVGG